MEIILHGNAKTTPRIRKEIQESVESAKALAERYGLNIKTILKWRKADGIEDKRSGPLKPKSVLSEVQQELICEFRRVTKFSLDDIYITLKDKIPELSRSNLHRCLKRNGLSVLPKEEAEKREKKKFKDYPIGFVHIDITEIRTDEGRCYLFVGIDRASKYLYTEIHNNQTAVIASSFLKNFIANCSFKPNKVLTDNGSQFTYELLAKHLRPRNKQHPFDIVCSENKIEHRLTKFRHPWTNGQVEVTNRIIKQYTTKSYFYETTEELKVHMNAFVLYYNHQRKLKSLKYQTPFSILQKGYEENPSDFNFDPNHMIMGLNM